MRQVADDPGWQFKWPWLGPKGVRWWVTWTVDEWALAFFCWLFTSLLLLFVIPAGAVAAGITYLIAHNVSQSRRQFWAFMIIVGLLMLMLSSSPGTWLTPLWPPLAVILGVGSPFLLLPVVGHFINWNRPLAYWMRLPRIVAAGPRQTTPQRIDPSALALLAGPEPTVIDSPVKYGKSPVTHPLLAGTVLPPLTVQKAIAGKPVKHRWIGRTENGFYIGGTRYDILWRF